MQHFVCARCREHHRYRSQRWHSAGICNRFSHTTLIIASGKGLCANGRAVPEGTTERKRPIPTQSRHFSCCLQLPGHEPEGFLLASHEQEGQQCSKNRLGISPFPLQDPNAGALHLLVLLPCSSAGFLCLLPVGPKAAPQLGWNRTSPLAAPLDKVRAFWVGNWNRGKTMCGDSARLNWDEWGSSSLPEMYPSDTGERRPGCLQLQPSAALPPWPARDQTSSVLRPAQK